MSVALDNELHTYTLVASFAVCFTGSYCAMAICEQLRGRPKYERESSHCTLCSLVLAIALCAVWSTHITAMGALRLRTEDGVLVPVRYDVATCFISLAAALLFVYIGQYFATSDRIFSKERAEVFEMLLNDARHESIQTIRNRTYIVRLAMFKGIGPIIVGGVITGIGVCLMHFIGMNAIVADVEMAWHSGIFVAAVCVAIVIAVVGTWVTFRLLSLYSEWEVLRIASTLTMTIAVCGMHFTGMAAVTFTYKAGSSHTTVLSYAVSSETVVFIALLCGLGVSWMLTIFTQSDLRLRHIRTRTFLTRIDNLLHSSRHSAQNIYLQYRNLKQEAIVDERECTSTRVHVTSDQTHDVSTTRDMDMEHALETMHTTRHAAPTFTLNNSVIEDDEIEDIDVENQVTQLSKSTET